MFRSIEPPRIKFSIEPISTRLPSTGLPDFLQMRLSEIQTEVNARLIRIASDAKLWVCNSCGHDGPPFEGTAVQPEGWLTGSLEMQGGGLNKGDVEMAICPACLPGFRRQFDRPA